MPALSVQVLSAVFEKLQYPTFREIWVLAGEVNVQDKISCGREDQSFCLPFQLHQANCTISIVYSFCNTGTDFIADEELIEDVSLLVNYPLLF